MGRMRGSPRPQLSSCIRPGTAWFAALIEVSDYISWQWLLRIPSGPTGVVHAGEMLALLPTGVNKT